jgi:hypothetical protein
VEPDCNFHGIGFFHLSGGKIELDQAMFNVFRGVVAPAGLRIVILQLLIYVVGIDASASAGLASTPQRPKSLLFHSGTH